MDTVVHRHKAVHAHHAVHGQDLTNQVYPVPVFTPAPCDFSFAPRPVYGTGGPKHPHDTLHND